jgi:hypothetical protein
VEKEFNYPTFYPDYDGDDDEDLTQPDKLETPSETPERAWKETKAQLNALPEGAKKPRLKLLGRNILKQGRSQKTSLALKRMMAATGRRS